MGDTMRRFWLCGRGKWIIIGGVSSILLFYQVIISLFILTRLNLILLMVFLVMAFLSFIMLFL